MPSYGPEVELGAFIATTDVYDVQMIYELDINSQEFKEFLVRLRQSINNVALLLNIKDTGYYPLTEFICSKAYYPDPALGSATPQQPVQRQVFRKTFDLALLGFPTLPNNATITIPHGITYDGTFPVTFTLIMATANDPIGLTSIPIPYVGFPNMVGIYVDTANIYITTNFDARAYTVTNVVLEWLKQ